MRRRDFICGCSALAPLGMAGCLDDVRELVGDGDDDAMPPGPGQPGGPDRERSDDQEDDDDDEEEEELPDRFTRNFVLGRYTSFEADVREAEEHYDKGLERMRRGTGGQAKVHFDTAVRRYDSVSSGLTVLLRRIRGLPDEDAEMVALQAREHSRRMYDVARQASNAASVLRAGNRATATTQLRDANRKRSRVRQTPFPRSESMAVALGLAEAEDDEGMEDVVEEAEGVTEEVDEADGDHEDLVDEVDE